MSEVAHAPSPVKTLIQRLSGALTTQSRTSPGPLSDC